MRVPTNQRRVLDKKRRNKDVKGGLYASDDPTHMSMILNFPHTSNFYIAMNGQIT